MAVLILAEHDGEKLNPSIQNTVSAAQSWNGDIHVLVAGNGIENIANQAAKLEGVDRVIEVNAAHLQKPIAEDIANLLHSISQNYQVILAAHSSFSKNTFPRLAALLDVGMMSDILEIKENNTYARSIYAGNVLSTIQSTDALQVLTVHASRFKAVSFTGNAEIIKINAPSAFTKTVWKSESRTQSDRPPLASAKIVVSGGRSLGSAEQFESILSPLANKLGAALGATRAAVDAGYAPNDIQVGQTGVVVAPELYIAVGVSGAIQHTYGMKDSKIIVAINQDPDAAIFQVADYGLVADLFEAVPALTQAIQ